MTILNRVIEFLKTLFRISPRNEGRVELAIVRIAIALLLANNFLFDVRPVVESQRGLLGDAVTNQSIEVLDGLTFFFKYDYDEQPHPEGMTSLWGVRNLWGLLPESKVLPINIPLQFLADPEIFSGGGTHVSEWPFMKLLFAVMLVFFCFGVSPVVSCGYIAFIVIAVGSLRNSQGNTHHGTQIVAMAVLGHWLGYIWYAWRQRSWKGAVTMATQASQRTSFFAAQQMAAAAYVVAGATKLLRSGFAWFSESPNIAIQVLKIGNQHYYGDGDKAPFDHAQKVAAVISAYPHITQLMLGVGLFAELLAFFALYNKKLGLTVGLSLVAMHLFVGYLMQLTFPLNNFILLFYFIPLPFALSRVFTLRSKSGNC
ncbi:MAG: hypothetical protein KDN22_29165 [Verrucomicrobiae bacterium]|nr:hypothetical protein [Verrucomicrobiae bacterium]